MPLRLTYRWEEQDKAVKLVGNSAESRALAQWPKRQRRILVEVICPQQMKRSPWRFYWRNVQKSSRYVCTTLQREIGHSGWRQDSRIETVCCRLRFSFHWFNQINDSSQISSIWQECLSLGSWNIRLSIKISLIPSSWRRNRVCNAKGGSYKWTECMNCFQSAIYTICST